MGVRADGTALGRNSELTDVTLWGQTRPAEFDDSVDSVAYRLSAVAPAPADGAPLNIKSVVDARTRCGHGTSNG
jgi:hypothetical protein